MGNEKRAGIVRGLLLVIMAVCLIQIARAQYISWKHRQRQETLKHSLDTTDREKEVAAKDGTSLEEDLEEMQILPQFRALYEINPDLVGWLTIEGTEIDYPVVSCAEDDYYLSHNFYREEDKYGCLFVREYAGINPPGTNIVIYGHSMKDGSMFGSLEDYKREEFFWAHSRISFDTLYEDRIYEVMAVFPSRVYEEEDVFKYYRFYQADTEEEFQDFYDNVKKLSLYDTGVVAEFGDTFITLSTCAYHEENGRFVVVAKRKTSG
ncbi:MAG: class B sortase [Muribaculaceae bacterium]|nr:class B sortase [Muribaculaceae bacterium]